MLSDRNRRPRASSFSNPQKRNEEIKVFSNAMSNISKIRGVDFIDYSNLQRPNIKTSQTTD